MRLDEHSVCHIQSASVGFFFFSIQVLLVGSSVTVPVGSPSLLPHLKPESLNIVSMLDLWSTNWSAVALKTLDRLEEPKVRRIKCFSSCSQAESAKTTNLVLPSSAFSLGYHFLFCFRSRWTSSIHWDCLTFKMNLRPCLCCHLEEHCLLFF